MRLVEELVEAFVRQADVRSPEGILLIGSGSRGETAARTFQGSPQLLSDLEFLAVVTDSSRRTKLEETARAASSLHDSPFFHIDVTALLPEQLRRQRYRFWLWEAMAGGRLVAGHDFRPLMPAVTASSLDVAEANEILLWQFWRVFSHLQVDVLNAHAQGVDVCSETCFEMRQAAARAILDVPTWFLATDGELRVGFRARQASFAMRDDVPEEIRDNAAFALKVRLEGAETTCMGIVTLCTETLLWADDTRRSRDRARRRLTDTSPRAQASGLKYFNGRHGIRVVPKLPQLLKAKRLLMERCRSLAERLHRCLVNGDHVPAGWIDDWRSARLDAEQSISWIARQAQ